MAQSLLTQSKTKSFIRRKASKHLNDVETAEQLKKSPRKVKKMLSSHPTTAERTEEVTTADTADINSLKERTHSKQKKDEAI
jgi:hypothetical protein